MPTIEFIAQGHSSLLGPFCAGERKTVTEEQAAHFCDQAMAAVRVLQAPESAELRQGGEQHPQTAKPARKNRVVTS